jgi:drug/metabolite transporter (DMT)-like permease
VNRDRGAIARGVFWSWLGVTAFSVTLPATRHAVRSLDPWFVSMGRAVIAGGLAVVTLAATRLPLPARHEMPRIVGVAVGVVIGFPVLSTLAVRHLPASHAAITNGLLPLATVGLACAIAGERPTTRWWIGTSLGAAALVAFAIVTDGATVSVGHPLMLAAVFVAAVGYVSGGVLSRTRPGWWVISWALVLTLPVTTVIAVTRMPSGDVPATAWLAFAYLGVVSMFLGFFAWYAGLATAGISRASQVQLLQPIETFLWAAVLLGEPLGAPEWLAALAVIAALAIGRSSRTDRRVVAPLSS